MVDTLAKGNVFPTMDFMHRYFLIISLLANLFGLAMTAQGQELGFNEEKVMALLERYAGRWVGTYEMRDMNGQVLQTLEADVVYHWETTENGRVLKGRAVYGADNGMAIAESETFIANKQLFSIVEEGGKARTYRGRLDKTGKTVSWTPIDTDRPLDESLRETFGRDASGQETLSSQAYENLTRNGITMLLTMHGLLYREPLESAVETPTREY